MTQKPDAVELKPCPFCSSVDVLLQWMSPDIPGIQEEDHGYGYDGPDRADYYIECRGCALTTDSYLSGTTIVEKWNTRDTAELDALRREVEAGKSFIGGIYKLLDDHGDCERGCMTCIAMRRIRETYLVALEGERSLEDQIASGTKSWDGVDTDKFIDELRGR